MSDSYVSRCVRLAIYFRLADKHTRRVPMLQVQGDPCPNCGSFKVCMNCAPVPPVAEGEPEETCERHGALVCEECAYARGYESGEDCGYKRGREQGAKDAAPTQPVEPVAWRVVCTDGKSPTRGEALRRPFLTLASAERERDDIDGWPETKCGPHRIEPLGVIGETP